MNAVVFVQIFSSGHHHGSSTTFLLARIRNISLNPFTTFPISKNNVWYNSVSTSYYYVWYCNIDYSRTYTSFQNIRSSEIIVLWYSILVRKNVFFLIITKEINICSSRLYHYRTTICSSKRIIQFQGRITTTTYWKLIVWILVKYITTFIFTTIKFGWK